MSHIKFSKIASVISQKYDQIGDYAYSDKFDKYANSLYKLAQEEVDNEEVNEDDHSKYIIDHPIAQEQTENIKEDLHRDDQVIFDKLYNIWSSGSSVQQSVMLLSTEIKKPEYILITWINDIIEKVLQKYYKYPNVNFFDFTRPLLSGNIIGAVRELLYTLEFQKKEQTFKLEKAQNIQQGLKYIPDDHVKDIFSQYMSINLSDNGYGSMINDLMNFKAYAEIAETVNQFNDMINSSNGVYNPSYLENYKKLINLNLPLGSSLYKRLNLSIVGSNYSSDATENFHYVARNIENFLGIQELVQITPQFFKKLYHIFSPQQMRMILDNIKNLTIYKSAESLIQLSTLMPLDQAIVNYKNSDNSNVIENYISKTLGDDYQYIKDFDDAYKSMFLILFAADYDKAKSIAEKAPAKLSSRLIEVVNNQNAKYFLDYISQYTDYLKFDNHGFTEFLKKYPSRLHEVLPDEFILHNNPDNILKYHSANPEWQTLSDTEKIEYSGFYRNHIYAVDHPYKELYSHTETGIPNYVLFKSTDPNLSIVADNIVNQSKQSTPDAAQKIASRYTKNDIFDIKNFNFNGLNNEAFQHLSLTELNLLSDEVNYFESLEKIKKVKESIANTPAYQKYPEGSAEYNKLLYIIFHHYDLRGRNPLLLIRLLDLHGQEDFIKDLNISNERYLGANRVVLDFNNAPFQEVKDKTKIRRDYYNTVLSAIYRKYKDPMNLQNTALSKYPIEKVYEILSSVSNNEGQKTDIPQSITERNIENAINAKNNKNILLMYLNEEQMLKLFKIIFDQYTSHQENNDYIEVNSLLPDEITPEFIKQIEGVKIPDKINIDFSETAFVSHSSTEREYVNDSMILLRIFEKQLPNFLDKYALLTQKYDISAKFSDLDDYARSLLIHNAAGKFDKIDPGKGLADFIIQNMTATNIAQIAKMAKSWNKNIILLDENFKKSGESKISELAKTKSFSEIIELINASTSLVLFSKVDVTEPALAKEFIKHIEFDDNEEKQSVVDENERLTSLYKGLQDIFKNSKNSIQPWWASLKATKEGYTARFLPRDDPRGMFLGNYADCCQHPDSWAASVAIDGQISKKSSFFVIEDQKGSMILESYVWEDNHRQVCFDSFETIGSKVFGSVKAQQICQDLIYEIAQDMNTNVNYGTLSNGSYKPERFNQASPDPFENWAKPWERPFVKHVLSLNDKGIDPEELYIADSERQNIIIQQ